MHPSDGWGSPRIGRAGHAAGVSRVTTPIGVVTSDRALLQLATLPLGEAAPDAEALVVPQGVLEAVAPHLAGQADLLGLPGRAALLGEERLRIRLSAQGALLPSRFLGVRVEEKQFPHGARPFDPRLLLGSDRPYRPKNTVGITRL